MSFPVYFHKQTMMAEVGPAYFPSLEEALEFAVRHNSKFGVPAEETEFQEAELRSELEAELEAELHEANGEIGRLWDAIHELAGRIRLLEDDQKARAVTLSEAPGPLPAPGSPETVVRNTTENVEPKGGPQVDPPLSSPETTGHAVSESAQEVKRPAPQVSDVEPPAPVVEQMAEAAGRVVLTPTEAEAKRNEADRPAKVAANRDALKTEFRRVYEQSGMRRSDLARHCDPPGGLNKEGWLGNRLSGTSWPTQADVDALKAGIGRAKAASTAPRNRAPAPSASLADGRTVVNTGSPDAPLRRIHLDWEAVFDCAVMLAQGRPDDEVAQKISRNYPGTGGSPMCARDVEEVRPLVAGYVKELQNAKVISLEEYNLALHAIRLEVKQSAAGKQVTVEYWRNAE